MSTITRVFRVKIIAELRDEFEPLFQSKSLAAVNDAPGFIEASIGQPTSWTPDEYVMISVWENEQSLIDFVGSDWNQAHIPAGMEKFVDTCWVHHYKSFL